MEDIKAMLDPYGYGYDNVCLKSSDTGTAIPAPINHCQDNGDSIQNIPISDHAVVTLKSTREVTADATDLNFLIFHIPEILECIFKFTRTSDLTNFRLINQTWNREACRILRRKSYCHLRELNEKEVTDFTKIFTFIKKNKTPSPFRNYYISAEALKNEFVNFVLENSEIQVVHLNLRKSPPANNSEFQRNLYKVLIKHGNTIEYFRCALRFQISHGLKTKINSNTTNGINVDENDFHSKEKTIVAKQRLYLPALKDFGFWEHDEASKDSCLDFIVDMINSSPNLTHLCPGSFDENVLPHVLNNCNLTNIQDLYILFITDVHISALAQVNLPNLKSLTVQVTPRSNLIRRSESMQEMVSNFAASLQNLTISWFSSSPDETFPVCPKLESLIIGSWNGPIKVFESSRLPSLRKIHMQDLEISNFDLCPHCGVEEFVYESTEANLPFETMEEHEGFIEFLSCQYPRLKFLDLTSPLSDEIVRAVIRNFTLLETLILDTDYSLSENIFTGINMFTLRRHLHNNQGNIDESITRMPSLRDMKWLKTLIIGRYSKSRFPHGLQVTNNAVRFGLALMPALEVLQLNWNPELSVVCLRQNLNHLTKIVINNSHSYERYEILENLKEVMPQVDLGIPKHESHLDKRHDRLMLSSDY